MYHADPSGVYQLHRVDMMPECSTGELFIFMQYDDKGHAALKHYASLKAYALLMGALFFNPLIYRYCLRSMLPLNTKYHEVQFLNGVEATL